MIITIDGPAGTGKSTVAKLVANKIGFTYFDTGAMYRAIAAKMLQEDIDLENEQTLSVFLEKNPVSIIRKENNIQYFVGNEDFTHLIRTTEVTRHASKIATYKRVRQSLVNQQRILAQEGNFVCEGRDMGTVVFPDAFLKIYLIASAPIRAKRRYKELIVLHPSITEEAVLHDIIERDTQDSQRIHSPLQPALDAVLIDTSLMTIEEVVEKIITIKKEKRS